MLFAIDYFEAWEGWLDHQSLSRETLWGVEIFWWGRIGKLLQLVGGLTVVAEWVGAQRMRDASALLRKGHIQRVGGRAWRIGKEGLRRYWRLLRGGAGPATQFLTSAITLVVAIAGIVPALASTEIVTIIATVVIVALLLPVVALTLLMIVSLLGRGLDLILVRPLASLLESGDAVKWSVQVTGLLLLVAGVHFDLLAG